MLKLKNKLAEAILARLDAKNDAHGLDSDSIAQMFEYPPDRTMGDVAFPCFKLSKALRAAPPQIAAMLADCVEIPEIAKTDIAGGYLNMFISDSYLSERLSEINMLGDNYGRFDFGAGKTIVLDYSSPNVAKPFHIGHLGTTVIGHSLKMLHEFAGYDCIGINHLGDWGTQFGKLIVAYRLWGDHETIERGGIDELVSLYVKFHEEAEKDASLNDRAREEFTKLEHFDDENIKLWKWFIEISLAEYSKTYKQLGIEFDSYNGESFYSDKMPAIVEELREKKLMTLDDGASIVNLEEFNMPPCLILKRDGSTLYPTRDISAAKYRKDNYNFDKCIYVTSAGQSLHFAQWFKVVELMCYEWAKDLVHVPYGTVSINGEKLATRTGNVILLKDLFAMSIDKVRGIIKEKNPDLENSDEVAEAVGVGAIVFHYLSNSRIKDINFVLEDALSFEGNTGPYSQYTYARTCSILNKAASTGGAGEFTDDTERELVKVLAKYPEKILSALSDYEPMVITRYILDVCNAFNRFYHSCQILNADDESVKNTRIYLTNAVNHVLKTAFTLICIKPTEKI
ncbi:MAG: arginine--tRNA ligase [Ruminococcaceae bacterium]|nr:arginine--tRNA ligase [Oscillospiraceae bacterium]